MATKSRIFKVFIASPSDVENERQIAVDAILEWNIRHSDALGVVLMPIRWETHSTPAYGVRPQELINKLVENADLVIGIFWTRIGSPSGQAQSGTLEEIELSARNGTKVMLYFSDAQRSPSEIDVEQLLQLRAFKDKIKPVCLYNSYSSIAEFANSFSRHLDQSIRILIDTNSASEDLQIQFKNDQQSGSAIKLVMPVIRIPDSFKASTFILSEMAEKIRDHFGQFFSKTVGITILNPNSTSVLNLFVDFRLESRYPSPTTEIEQKSTQFKRHNPYHRFSTAEPLVQCEGNSWEFSYYCPSLHAKRHLNLTPLRLIANREEQIKLTATVYSDSFYEKQIWNGVVDIVEEYPHAFSEEIEQLFAQFPGEFDRTRWSEFNSALAEILPF